MNNTATFQKEKHETDAPHRSCSLHRWFIFAFLPRLVKFACLCQTPVLTRPDARLPGAGSLPYPDGRRIKHACPRRDFEVSSHFIAGIGLPGTGPHCPLMLNREVANHG